MKGDGCNLYIRGSFADPDVGFGAEESAAVRVDAIKRSTFIGVENVSVSVSHPFMVDVEETGTQRLLAVGRKLSGRAVSWCLRLRLSLKFRLVVSHACLVVRVYCEGGYLEND